MARYNNKAEQRKQELFWSGPVDPSTGNYTKSIAEKEGVTNQWPKTPSDREKLRNLHKKYGLGY